MCEAWRKTKSRANRRIWRKRYKYDWEIDVFDRINFFSGCRRRPTKTEFVPEYSAFFNEMDERYGEGDG